MEKVANKMTSVESIGSCSLDVEAATASGSSILHEELTVSEFTLKSMSLSGDSKSQSESKKEGSVKSKEIKRLSAPKGLLTTSEEEEYTLNITNGHSIERRHSSEIAKLPSYLGVSCAINGYTNYSKFCRLREGSSSFSDNKISDYSKPNSLSAPLSRYENIARQTYITPPSDNGKIGMKKVPDDSLKSYDILVNKENIKCGDLNGTVDYHGHYQSNGCQELTPCETDLSPRKSLVQQRIACLYGEDAAEKARLSRRKVKYNLTNRHSRAFDATDNAISQVPLSPPYQGRTRSCSPPVFRRLNRDFRLQLQHARDPVVPSRNSVHYKSLTINGSDKESSPPMQHLKKKENKFVNNKPKVVHSPPKEANVSPSKNSLSNSQLEKTANLEPKPSDCISDTVCEDSQNPSATLEKNGQWFLNVMEEERQKILIKIKEYESSIDDEAIPEDTKGKIRSAVGKANLLLTQKFEQFKGLCHSNLKPKETDAFPTTVDDLEGFWEMVLLQVTNIHDTFFEIQKLKENNWQEIKPQKSRVKSLQGGSKSTPTSPHHKAKKSEESRIRDEARKKLLEAKRRGRQQVSSSQDENKDQEVEIFVPDSKT